MKLGAKKQERWQQNWSKYGRKKGYKAQIVYHSMGKCFCFLISKGDYSFNSCWKGWTFNTEQDCLKKCEDFIDYIVKNGEEK